MDRVADRLIASLGHDHDQTVEVTAVLSAVQAPRDALWSGPDASRISIVG